VKKSLSILPCFIHVEKISSITSGLSQKCFKVYADNRVYFAKTTSNEIEAKIAVIAAKNELSPAVFYHDKHWLITDFIDADNLALSRLSHSKKINHAVKLMSKCHHLSLPPAKLEPKKITYQLIHNNYYSEQKETELSQLAESILPSLNHSKNLVCCHGDINFSNILIDQKKNTWLIDYECACSAPIEYDLAMFIAVNNISEDNIIVIIEQYENHSCSVKVDIELLQIYLTFSYFINSLWYTQAYQRRSDIALLDMHKQQWKKFTSSRTNK